MTGLTLEPVPAAPDHRHAGRDRRLAGARRRPGTDLALVLDSELDVAGEPCSISFLLLPTDGGVTDLLTPLGLAA